MLYLYPCKEQIHRVHVVVLCLPKGQKFKIGVDVWLFQQFRQQVVHFDGPENIEYNGNNGELQKRLSLLLLHGLKGLAGLLEGLCVRDIFVLPEWQQYPGYSRYFWSRRTCVYVAQGSPPQCNRGWINRRPSHSRGWNNPRLRCIGLIWLFLSGRKGSLHRLLGIQPPVLGRGEI